MLQIQMTSVDLQTIISIIIFAVFVQFSRQEKQLKRENLSLVFFCCFLDLHGSGFGRSLLSPRTATIVDAVRYNIVRGATSYPSERFPRASKVEIRVHLGLSFRSQSWSSSLLPVLHINFLYPSTWFSFCSHPINRRLVPDHFFAS